MAINRCLKIVDHAILGDTLTIVLQENVSASKSSSANASRDGKTNFGFDTVPRYLQGLFVTLVPMSKPPVVTRSTERRGQCQQYL
ncbi:flagellar basal body L-ring protein [Escherichia coli]|uniref:Flagellar basal body L-ring protein n=1 Tax=Escherichia coli TaxID=562 RepID=A0A376ZV74_ECOLX|nr:flagellar basal body L-ring protein [Escherichia coli]